MGKNQKRLLLFAIRYPGWHTWTKNRPTYDAIRRLKQHGIIETNKFGQFSLRRNWDGK